MSSRYYSGIVMAKPKIFNLRMPSDLRDAVENRARERLRSINNEIVILLKLGLANEAEETGALKKADNLIGQQQKQENESS
jgi:hypothetical protein